MAQVPVWQPVPSPYPGVGDDRPPSIDQPPPHHASSYHPQAYPPPLPPPGPSHTPTYPAEPGYSRQPSVSASTRSPPQYTQYAPQVNGGPPEAYVPLSDSRTRTPYGAPGSPAHHPQPPSLHLQISHEMMPGQPTMAQNLPHSYHGAPPPSSAGVPPSPYAWGPPPQPQYWAEQPRRKPVRAAQACDSCRSRKAKCDEGRPTCQHCKENGLTCVYREIPPQKSEKQVIAINDRLTELKDEVSGLKDRLDRVTGLLEASLAREHTMYDTRYQSSVPMSKTRSRPSAKDNDRTTSTGINNPNHPFTSPFQASGSKNVAESEAGTRSMGPMSASDLLLWPSIRELVPPEYRPSYVMDSEVERGILRLYGCGEGEDKGDGHDAAPSPTANILSSRAHEGGSVGSTDSPSGVWGVGQLPQRDISSASNFEHVGGVSMTGQLMLDCSIVDKYVESYFDRMHILHPFLNPRVLRSMVNTFKSRYSWDYKAPSAHNRINPHIGSKRKRENSDSPNSMPDEHYTNARLTIRQQPIEHSITSAIVLLVLALGNVCGYNKPLPGPVNSKRIASQSSKVAQAHLGYSDFPPSSSAPASPFASTSRTNGVHSTPAGSLLHGKNMDVIPGLAYFAKASDILGETNGGVDVSFIQANLLAGLYMGQLGRVLQSHSFISKACVACQILINSQEYKDKKMPVERRNLINYAFWSCLQLESDILAEVRIPESGIIKKEASMLLEMPNALSPGKELSDAQRADQDILMHYLNQIQLRRTLNDAVNNIYTADREDGKPSGSIINTIGESLENWRRVLGPMNWSDDDHESPDINDARVRGKYYGAKYIIHRPALHYALAQGLPGTPASSRAMQSPAAPGDSTEYTSPAVSLSNHTSKRISEMKPPPSRQPELDDWIYKACRTCIEAAIKSTTAFDKVPGRLVVTNILGTAHAQYGNVLVLAGTFNSANPELSSLVSEDTLRHLMLRTIRFLEEKAPISPALGIDAQILRHVQMKLFPSANSAGLTRNITPHSSFTSNR